MDGKRLERTLKKVRNKLGTGRAEAKSNKKPLSQLNMQLTLPNCVEGSFEYNAYIKSIFWIYM
jgi:hypothetical protein